MALSWRLRDALAELYTAAWEPSLESEVLEGLDAKNVYHRDWAAILKAARLPHYRLKDLRDSYASWLLTAGVQLAYVSKQLGHSDIATTARHYVAWVDGEEYVEPMRLAKGDVPADLIAQVPTRHRRATDYGRAAGRASN